MLRLLIAVFRILADLSTNVRRQTLDVWDYRSNIPTKVSPDTWRNNWDVQEFSRVIFLCSVSSNREPLVSEVESEDKKFVFVKTNNWRKDFSKCKSKESIALQMTHSFDAQKKPQKTSKIWQKHASAKQLCIICGFSWFFSRRWSSSFGVFFLASLKQQNIKAFLRHYKTKSTLKRFSLTSNYKTPFLFTAQFTCMLYFLSVLGHRLNSVL